MHAGGVGKEVPGRGGVSSTGEVTPLVLGTRVQSVSMLESGRELGKFGAGTGEVCLFSGPVSSRCLSP